MSCHRNTSRGCCFRKTEEGVTTAKAVVGCNKMETWDWLADLPNPLVDNDIYEVQFKNTRKGYYQLPKTMAPLSKGDIVTVESAPGHDVGIVSLTGQMVTKQMKRTGFNPIGAEFRKVLRLANAYDIERWQEAISLEYNTMIHSREIVSRLGLNMKVGDVEYQGDRMKAIFYYIADQRVDFRELIKVLAEQFKVRVEMKQIGARQEAGRIGGISACGRELCCSTWQNSFSTVTIGAARHQDISLNPQKLAGQCGKLKCCLNYEVDSYIDARKDFPRLQGPLEAMDGTYHLVKTDILGRIMWFSPDASSMAVMIPLSVERVHKIVALNRKGVKVDKLEDETMVRVAVAEEPAFENVVGQDSLTRFDRQGGSNSRRNRNRRGGADREKDGASKQASGGEQSTNSDTPTQQSGADQRKGGAKQGNRNNRQRGEQREGNREGREPREGRDMREGRETRDNRESRDNRREGRENRESRENREGREGREVRENREPREGREPRENRDNRQSREGRPMRENREPRAPRPQGERTAENGELRAEGAQTTEQSRRNNNRRRPSSGNRDANRPDANKAVGGGNNTNESNNS